jgi:hypothetical protein
MAPYGNYFLQRLYKVLEINHKLAFINKVIILKLYNKISANIVEISNDNVGTHAIQHIISSLCHKSEKKLLIDSLIENYFNLEKNLNGVHVIEKLLHCYDETMLYQFYQIILGKLIEYAKDENTLCLVIIFG